MLLLGLVQMDRVHVCVSSLPKTSVLISSAVIWKLFSFVTNGSFSPESYHCGEEPWVRFKPITLAF